MTVFGIKAVFDINCPCCYIGHTYLSRAIATRKTQHPEDRFNISLIPFSLKTVDPSAPIFHVPTQSRQKLREETYGKVYADSVLHNIKQASKAAGLNLKFDGPTGVTRNGHRQLYHEQEVDITEQSVLTDVGFENGLGSKEQVEGYLVSGEDGKDVDEMSAEAHEEHAGGVPWFEIWNEERGRKQQISGAESDRFWENLFQSLSLMIFKYFNHSLGLFCASTIALQYSIELRKTSHLPPRPETSPDETFQPPGSLPVFLTEEVNTINFFRSILAAIGRKHKPHRGQQGGGKAGNSWRDSIGSFFKIMDDNVPPRTLQGRTVEALAQHIKDGKIKKVVVMTGAGISTSAGIPDFRSPDTGLYANLARLNLPYAEAVFDINYFRKKPEPFYELAHELYPGKFRPTITHSFIRLLNDKGILLKHFTQNIDCLDREAGVPDDKIIEAHGSFARQSCIECQMPYPEEYIKVHIEEKTIPRCELCKGLVKPEIVFFGEALPAEFFRNRMLPSQADLIIVMGTSLTVHPFASLPDMTRESTPRLLINQERVGSLGSQRDDVLLIGDCDAGVRKLADACGWRKELEALWAATPPRDAPKDEEKKDEEVKKTKDEALEDEIDKLTKSVDKTLNLSKWLDQKVRGESGGKPAESSAASAAKSQHEDEKGDLSHVFVSNGKAASATTPVVPESTSKDVTNANESATTDPGKSKE